MFFTNTCDKLYLNNWEYNGVRVINALAGLVTENGGRVKNANIGTIENRNTGDTQQVNNLTYISFILDGIYYYYQIDTNPFFEFYYHKAPITGDTYNCTYLEEDSKKWCYGDIYSDLTQEDINQRAKMLYDFLTTAKNSKVYKERKRTYNRSWTYVTKTQKIDF